MNSTRWVVLTRAMFLALGASAPAAERTEKAEAPVSLQPRETWWETMLASREALVEQEAVAERQAEALRLANPVLKDFQPLRMELSGQQELRKIRVRIAGMKQLYLGCAGQTEAFLADAQVIGRDGKAAPLTLAKTSTTKARDGWFRQSREPIVWGRQKFATGFVMMNSEVYLELEGGAEWLEGVLGAKSKKDLRPLEFWAQWRSHAGLVAKAVAARRSLAAWVAEAFTSSVDSRQQRLETVPVAGKLPWGGLLARIAFCEAGVLKQDQA